MRIKSYIEPKKTKHQLTSIILHKNQLQKGERHNLTYMKHSTSKWQFSLAQKIKEGKGRRRWRWQQRRMKSKMSFRLKQFLFCCLQFLIFEPQIFHFTLPCSHGNIKNKSHITFTFPLT